jgi:serine/threonine protein kinase
VGSNRYLSPECYAYSEEFAEFYNEQNQYLSPAADVWALGVVLINMVSGKTPWNEATQQDHQYEAYSDSGSLKKRLNLTLELDHFLYRRVFCDEPRQRANPEDFKRFVTSQSEFIDSNEKYNPMKKSAPRKESVSHSDLFDVDWSSSSDDGMDTNNSKFALKIETESIERLACTGSFNNVGQFKLTPLNDEMITTESRVRLGRVLMNSSKHLSNIPADLPNKFGSESSLGRPLARKGTV